MQAYFNQGDAELTTRYIPLNDMKPLKLTKVSLVQLRPPSPHGAERWITNFASQQQQSIGLETFSGCFCF
jgi:hypothetical protein